MASTLVNFRQVFVRGFILFGGLLCSSPALALVEAHLGYAFYNQPEKPKYVAFGDDCIEDCIPKAWGGHSAYMMDILIRPFGTNLNLGIGFRQENFLGRSKGQSIAPGVTFLEQLQITRRSLLIDYHWESDFGYIGPIFTYGFEHWATMNLVYDSSGRHSENTFTPTSISSWTAGAQAGLIIAKHLLLGLEIGTAQILLKGFRSSNPSTTSFDIGLTGTYFQFMLGVKI